ncbi:MAG TPA: ADP-ribosylation factor-like protein [Candidatus Acidoferrum sp.]|nr:ADP-ribosylation factor-like protein [Candidatus Acidoferrum sp.]
MVSINYSSREVCCKIVYYGPGLSGKTTNLQYVHAKVPQTTRGKLISLATEADRTLYFDFLPINIGSINGFTAKFQLYTVPGQVYYNATRKLVLRGVDGIVFVADSQTDKMDENIESLSNLEDNLAEYGYNIGDIPIVLQYNKRDLPNVLRIEQLNAQLNKRGWPHFEASATIGNGVFDTLKMIIKLVLDKAKNSSSTRMRQSQAAGTAPHAAPACVAGDTATAGADGGHGHASAGQSGKVPVEFSGSESGRIALQSELVAHSTGRVAIPDPSAYRPYPGSEAAAPQRKATTPAPIVQAQTAAEPEPAVAPDLSHRMSEESPREKVVPQMAPPLRRRAEPKKRGFFKRLFGIK